MGFKLKIEEKTNKDVTLEVFKSDDLKAIDSYMILVKAFHALNEQDEQLLINILYASLSALEGNKETMLSLKNSIDKLLNDNNILSKANMVNHTQRTNLN